MKIHLFCLVMLFFLASCAAEKSQRLSKFIPESPRSVQTDWKKTSEMIYPEGRWQFVHTIEFTMADGSGSTVTGVTVLDGKEINSALMTIEGLTLFVARFTDSLKVLRAVPPFNKPVFAAGLMNDVRAIFIRPPGKNVRYGRLEKNAVAYRITEDDGRITDVIPSADDGWRINTYSPELIKTRTIIASSCTTMNFNRIPRKLELTVPGPTGYTLKMNLMSAEQLPTATTNNQKSKSPQAPHLHAVAPARIEGLAESPFGRLPANKNHYINRGHL